MIELLLIHSTISIFATKIVYLIQQFIFNIYNPLSIITDYSHLFNKSGYCGNGKNSSGGSSLGALNTGWKLAEHKFSPKSIFFIS